MLRHLSCLDINHSAYLLRPVSIVSYCVMRGVALLTVSLCAFLWMCKTPRVRSHRSCRTPNLLHFPMGGSLCISQYILTMSRPQATEVNAATAHGASRRGGRLRAAPCLARQWLACSRSQEGCLPRTVKQSRRGCLALCCGPLAPRCASSCSSCAPSLEAECGCLLPCYTSHNRQSSGHADPCMCLVCPQAPNCSRPHLGYTQSNAVLGPKSGNVYARRAVRSPRAAP